MRTIGGVIALLIILGFPRFPASDIPIAILVLPFFGIHILRCFRLRSVQMLISLWILLYLYGAFIWGVAEESEFADIRFLTVMYIKAMLTIFGAMAIMRVVAQTPVALYIWVAIQGCLILLSTMSDKIFDVLVMFGGQTGYDVYSEIGGLRGIGFGLIHVYGVYTMIGALAFIFFGLNPGRLARFSSASAFIISLFLARTGLVLGAILLLLYSPLRFLLVVGMFLFASYIFFLWGDIDSIAYQVLELGVNLFDQGSLQTASTNANIQMLTFPDEMVGWLLGYGRFFDGDIFYRGTDLGYSRLTLFGGGGFLFLHLIINLLPLVFARMLRSGNKNNLSIRLNILIPFFGLAFIAVLGKGLIDISIFAIILMIQASMVKERAKG